LLASRRHDLVPLVLSDPMEAGLPRAGLVSAAVDLHYGGGAKGFPNVIGIGVHSKEDDLGVGQVLPNLASGVNAVQHRHRNVQQDYIRPQSKRGFDQGSSILHRADQHARRVEPEMQALREILRARGERLPVELGDLLDGVVDLTRQAAVFHSPEVPADGASNRATFVREAADRMVESRPLAGSPLSFRRAIR